MRFAGDNSLSALCKFSSELQTASRILKKVKVQGPQVISLSPNLLLDISGREIRCKSGRRLLLSVGGVIELKDGVLVSQSFCISVLLRLDDALSESEAQALRCHPFEAGTHVIRKFHFDIDREVPNDQPARPLCHLQYGGNFEEEHFDVVDGLEYLLYGALDNPRIPLLPYSFILALDFAFRTFETPASKLVYDSGWKDKVIQSERRWIAPYLENVLGFIRSGSRNETLWDFCSQLKS